MFLTAWGIFVQRQGHFWQIIKKIKILKLSIYLHEGQMHLVCEKNHLHILLCKCQSYNRYNYLLFRNQPPQ